jgi:hypothetical protein
MMNETRDTKGELGEIWITEEHDKNALLCSHGTF